MKKTSAGLVLSIVAVVLAIIGLVAYFVNAGTNYFYNLGVNGVVVATGIIGIAALVIYIVFARGGPQLWTDILPVCASAMLIFSAITLVGARVAGIAAIMTFEGNANTRADMTSAIVAIAALLVSAVVSTVASFKDIKSV